MATKAERDEAKRQAIRDGLTEVTVALATHPDRLAERLKLWRQGQALGMTLKELGACAGVSETAVIKAFRRDDDRNS